MGRYVVWGHGKSWVVHWHDGQRVTWASHWFTTRADARAHADRLRQQANRRAA